MKSGQLLLMARRVGRVLEPVAPLERIKNEQTLSSFVSFSQERFLFQKN
jgi:hypothetical protein